MGMFPAGIQICLSAITSYDKATTQETKQDGEGDHALPVTVGSQSGGDNSEWSKGKGEEQIKERMRVGGGEETDVSPEQRLETGG